MKKIAKISLIALLCVICARPVSAQQSVQLTQYIFNSMSVNPAYAGYKEEWFAQLGLRSQWVGWEGAPKTGVVSIDGVVDPIHKRHGVGLQFMTDKLGAQAATSIYGNYALRLQVNDEDTRRISLGISGGITQYSLDGGLLDPSDPGDPVIPEGKISSWVPDVRLGVYYYSPKWYVGVSVQDMFSQSKNKDFTLNETTTESLYRNISAYLITGMLFELDRGLHLRPSVMIKDDFKGPTTMDLNAMFIFNNRLWLGAGYRTRMRVLNREYAKETPQKLSALNALAGIAQFYVTANLVSGEAVLGIGKHFSHRSQVAKLPCWFSHSVASLRYWRDIGRQWPDRSQTRQQAQ